jgi:hypothetical protein
MRYDMNLSQYVCCVCRVWLAGEDVSFYEMKGQQSGMRCVRDMCRRIRMGHGWLNIRKVRRLE